MSNKKKVLAAHLKDGDGHHAVAVGPLRVVILESDGGWYAQALEVDYATAGRSVEDVKARFERGFVKTIAANLRKFGSIGALFKRQAPAEYWAKFFEQSESQTFSCVSFHEFDTDDLPDFPFESIAYRTLETRVA